MIKWKKSYVTEFTFQKDFFILSVFIDGKHITIYIYIYIVENENINKLLVITKHQKKH